LREKQIGELAVIAAGAFITVAIVVINYAFTN
jgi:hypothetical protein